MIKKLFIPFLVFCWACHPQSKNVTEVSTDSLKSITMPSDTATRSYVTLDQAISGDIADTSLYYLIHKVSALYIQPDTSWMNEREKSMTEDDWNATLDDHQYYESMAEDSLKSMGIPVLYSPLNKRYLKFFRRDGQAFTYDKQKMKDAWGLILFNGTDKPVLFAGADINGTIKGYYKK